jgi:hypothetical protein
VHCGCNKKFAIGFGKKRFENDAVFLVRIYEDLFFRVLVVLRLRLVVWRSRFVEWWSGIVI